MKRLMWYGAALLFLGVVACPSLDNNLDCEQACEHLSQCGLLPSALGTTSENTSAEENCRARCQLTDKDTANVVVTCLLENSPGKDDPVGNWCKTTAAPCARTLSCLRNIVSRRSLVSELDVRIFVSPSEAGPAEAPRTRTTTCDTSCSACRTAFTADQADKWCQSANGLLANVFIEQSGRFLRSEPRRCAEVLSRATSLSGILPGPLRAGIEVRGSSFAPLPDGGGLIPTTQICRVFYGPEFLVLPSQTNVPVPLFQEYSDAGFREFECENSTDTCGDLKDNDQNGTSDCDDPKCAAICQRMADAGLECDAASCEADAACDGSSDCDGG